MVTGVDVSAAFNAALWEAFVSSIRPKELNEAQVNIGLTSNRPGSSP